MITIHHAFFIEKIEIGFLKQQLIFFFPLRCRARRTAGAHVNDYFFKKRIHSRTAQQKHTNK